MRGHMACGKMRSSGLLVTSVLYHISDRCSTAYCLSGPFRRVNEWLQTVDEDVDAPDQHANSDVAHLVQISMEV